MEVVAKEVCPFCDEIILDSAKSTTIRKTGAEGINKKSLEIGEDLVVAEGTLVHTLCRQHHLKKTKQNISSSSKNTNTRSSTGGFNFRTDCFLCGNSVTEREKNSKKVSLVVCKEKAVDKAIANTIEDRNNDLWAVE